MISGRDILLLSTADWDAPLWTNKQHIARRLAKSNRVFYVESLGLRAPRLCPGDLARAFGRVRRAALPAVQGNPEILSPLCAPFWGSALARRLNAAHLARRLSRHLRERKASRYILWTYVPFTPLFCDRLSPKPELLVYHFVDRLDAFPGVPAQAADAERELCGRADVVFFSSRGRCDALAPLCRSAVFVGNVAEPPGPAVPARLPELESLPRPRVGFAGALDSAKLDWDVLERLAGPEFPGSLVLVGPLAAAEDPARLAALRRSAKVLWLDAQPQARALALMAACDVLAVPYRLNEYTRFVFPMKLFEYLGLGKPVVATPLAELGPFAPPAALARSPEDFAQAALSEFEGDGEEKRRARRELASRHTWEALLERMSERLR